MDHVYYVKCIPLIRLMGGGIIMFLGLSLHTQRDTHTEADTQRDTGTHIDTDTDPGQTHTE